MQRVVLEYYGGVIQNLLAKILLKRRKGGTGLLEQLEQPDNIPPRDFFAYLAEHPLPEVDGDGERIAKGNEVIRFINRTDDILNLKRGVLYILRLSGNTGHCPFSVERYNPDLLGMEEKEEE